MRRERSRLFWKSTFFTSVVAFVGTITAISLIIGIYGMWLSVKSGGSPDLAVMARFSKGFGQYAGTLGTYMAAFAVGYWFARHHPHASRWNHLLIGGWLTALGAPFVILSSLPFLLVLRSLIIVWVLYSGLSFGGGLVARHMMASATLYTHLIQSLSTVTSEADLRRVLGEYRPLLDITHLAVWTADSAPHARFFLRVASWAARPVAFPPRLSISDIPLLQKVSMGESVPFRVSHLPLDERKVWERLGVKGGVLVPIAARKEEALAHYGVLFVGMTYQERVPGRVVRFYESLIPTLALALEKIRLLRQASEAAVLEERQRLAREIHDTLAQNFTSIIMHLEAAENAWTTDPALAQAFLDRARRVARDGLSEARRVVWALRPDILSRANLPQALERVSLRWSEETGIPAHVAVTGMPYPLPGDGDVVVIRAAQEALANVRKHARASRVDLTLSYLDDRVILDVQDDGVGFDSTTLERTVGFGLRAMRERVEARGGTLIVESTPGEGTTVVVSLPILGEGRGER